MEEKDIEKLLESGRSGNTTIQDAVLELKKAPFEDVGFARLDTHRGLRQGTSEVVFGQGKTPEQILKISEEVTDIEINDVKSKFTINGDGGYFIDNDGYLTTN